MGLGLTQGHRGIYSQQGYTCYKTILCTTTTTMDDTFWNEFESLATLAPVAPLTPMAPEPAVAVATTPFANSEVQQLPLFESSATSPAAAQNLLQRTLTDEIDTLRGYITRMINNTGDKITLMRIKKEVTRAWLRKHPDSKRNMNKFQEYVRDNIKQIRANNPTLSHADHMRLLGRMWNDTKPPKMSITGLKRTRSQPSII